MASPASDNRANEELERLLARELAIPRSGVRIVHGMTRRDKVLEIDLPTDRVMEWLNAHRFRA